MKTFDIALKYLKGIELTEKSVSKQHELFMADKENFHSNYHWRSSCFMACVYHLTDLHNDRPSCFYVACEIIESDRDLIERRQFEKYANTVYPKVSVDKWMTYCSGIKNPPQHLSNESEMMLTILFVAYSYLIENV